MQQTSWLLRYKSRLPEQQAMNRTLFFFALAICVASALVQTAAPLRARSAVGMSRATAPNMVVEELTALAQITEQLATNAGDFGGYTIPIIGLGTLAAVIALLAGPVED
ncbi:hypothetical protein AB1Y20_020310 [Prymnesium parvum]|uniref:Uncharacterized protein n=1 Tax=Prymnesium parvum TaxID=97485 RepID=A0AB34JT25_PRYPA